MSKLVQNSIPVLGTPPANYTGAATTSDIISLKNYHRAEVIIQTGAWAGGTAAVTLKQAIDVTGNAIKALSFTEYWTNKDDTSSPVLVRTTATSDTFDLVAVANATYVIDVLAETLDVDGGFDTIRVDVASPGANNDFYYVTIRPYMPRQADASMPDPTVD